MDATLESPGSLDDLRRRILEIADDLPPRLRQCAQYVLANPDRIALSTVAELAAEAGVQPSAFIRFCQAVGFAGFSDMQKLYRGAYARGWPDYPTRLDRLRARSGSPASLLGDFIDAGHKSLTLLSETVDVATFERAVALLQQGATIHVIGLRRSFPVASYLAYVLDRMKRPVLLHTGIGASLQEHAFREGDVLIAISFPPYSPETLDLARRAVDGGARVLGVSDGPGSPLRALSEEMLTVPETDVGAFRSLSATLSLAAALAVAVGATKAAGREESDLIDSME